MWTCLELLLQSRDTGAIGEAETLHVGGEGHGRDLVLRTQQVLAQRVVYKSVLLLWIGKARQEEKSPPPHTQKNKYQKIPKAHWDLDLKHKAAALTSV